DGLIINGGTFSTVTYTYNPATLDGGPFTANGHNGSVNLGGSIINYTGLEPLTNLGNSVNTIFNLPTGDGNNNATLGDDGLNNGLSQISGTGFETTTFANPSGSLTVNTGSDGETLTLAPLDSAFAATAIGLTGSTAA